MKKIIVLAAAALASAPALAGLELLSDPDFNIGDGAWGRFGNADFNDFFGGNRHASLFADGQGNFGGFFQLGIAGAAGTAYRLTLTDVRIEQNFNANFRVGLEFYLGDDATKIGEQFAIIDTNSLNDGLITGDGLSFSVDAFAPAGTVFVRPVFLFDNAAPSSGSQANAFVFAASLRVVPAPGMIATGLAALGLTSARRRR